MVEHEVEVHAIGPAADADLKRLDAYRHALVLELRNFGNPLILYAALARGFVGNLYVARVGSGVRISMSLPAPGHS